MSMNDTLASALSTILNSDRVGKHECMIRPVSKTTKQVLDLLKEHKYIDGYKEIQHSSGSYLVVSLNGQINKCGSIRPRHSVKSDAFEKYEKQYLIARNFGLLIVSTSQGMMTHADAKNKNLGGKLIACCY